MIDWGQALQIGLVGFALVFLILIILYIALWLTGRIGARFSSPKVVTSRDKKV